MTRDVAALLYCIKENIKAIEGGDGRTSLLEEVRADYLELLELIKLFLISERDSYYGYFLMNMQFQANFRADSIAGIKLNTFPPVFEANPLLLCKFSLKEIIFIVCHEIDHILLNHPAEMVKANPTGDKQTFHDFNLAADASVNDRIRYEIVSEKHGFMSPPEGLITSESLKRMLRLNVIRAMEHYAYYFNLIRDKRQKQGQQNGGEGPKGQSGGAGDTNGQESILQKQNAKDGTGSQSQSADNKPGDRQPSDSEQEEGEGEGGIVTAANCSGKLTDHNWEAGDDAEDAQAVVREFVNAVVGTMNEETRGMMPGYFLSEIQKINKPPVLSWQAILKKYVGTISANKKKTRTRLNRRQPERFDLSGAMDDKVLKIVVAIDTSGSMSDGMIAQVFNEIFAILAKRKHEITVIECDAEVRRVYKAKTPDGIKSKVAGRGGTCFTPVIEYINNDRYFRDALLIYFTDGYGEREIPRPRTYRNMWIVIGDARHLSVKEPYGAVLKL